MHAMSLAGIDINRFKSHSTRIAAVLKALDRGALVNKVMKTGQWKSKTVFDLFYNRLKGFNVAGMILGTD